ncbi:MAG: DUF4832 domain-containing protein, partial [Myxococcota bacterium]
KVVLRFSYYGDDSLDDAPLSVILTHIVQLTPIIIANSDIIVTMQAGFLGQWGEWHGSAYNTIEDETVTGQVLDGLLTALPEDRTVQVRKPTFKTSDYNDYLSETEAFAHTDEARIGHHNDCFLASDDDYGTYPASEVEEWKRYLAEDSKFVPIGGETCMESEYSTCDNAIVELEKLGYSYLNAVWYPGVLDSWEEDGCKEDIARLLGYRFGLNQVQMSSAVAPGGVLRLEMVIGNDGYTALFNERPVYVVLERNGVRFDGLLSVDPRWWDGGTTTQLSLELRVPATAEAGDWRVGLWFPDASDSLSDDPNFAIQLANDNVWDAATGVNWISDSLAIDTSAGGDVDPGATALVEITP